VALVCSASPWQLLARIFPEPNAETLKILLDNTTGHLYERRTFIRTSKEMFAPGEQELENLKAAVFELKAALTWERTQKVRLLEELGRYHGEIKRLQDRLTDLELQLAEGKHASAPSGSAMAERVEDGAPH